MTESFSWLLLLIFLSLSLCFSFSVFFFLMLSFFSIRLSSVGEREEICVCDKWWSCLRPPSEYTYTAAWHMPIIEQARREEKRWVMTRTKRDAIYSPSFSLVFSDDDVACRILSIYSIFYVSFVQSYNYMHRSTVNRFK